MNRADEPIEDEAPMQPGDGRSIGSQDAKDHDRIGITLDDANLGELALELDRQIAGTPQVGKLETFALWHGDEKFWRDVYTRMLGALGAGLAIAVAALFILTWRTEGGLTALFFIAPASLMLAGIATMPHYAWRRARRARKGLLPPSPIAYATSTLLLALTILIALGINEKSWVARNENDRIRHRTNCLLVNTQDWCDREWGRP
ncbi:MAG: hypothetical protein ACJ72L_11675 [Marmoricola sp.]